MPKIVQPLIIGYEGKQYILVFSDEDFPCEVCAFKYCTGELEGPAGYCATGHFVSRDKEVG